MTFPTVACLPSAKLGIPVRMLPHVLIAADGIQRRIVGRMTLVPKIQLDTYRFRTVIDWIEFRVHLLRVTQVQHVQQVLRRHLDRDSYIAPEGLGHGNTFGTCSIRVQEPPSLALIAAIYQDIIGTFGETAGSRVTAIEVSVDALPPATIGGGSCDSPGGAAEVDLDRPGHLVELGQSASDGVWVWEDHSEEAVAETGDGWNRLLPLGARQPH